MKKVEYLIDAIKHMDSEDEKLFYSSLFIASLSLTMIYVGIVEILLGMLIMSLALLVYSALGAAASIAHGHEESDKKW